jgi:ATP-dependent Clp protease ATP-binding subunit ClpX
MDNVKLDFDQEALEAIAAEAIKRNTGARGLRAIIEGIMLDVMFEVPSRDDIATCLVTKDVVMNKLLPELKAKDTNVKESKSTKKKEESA